MKNRWIEQLVETASRDETKLPWAGATSRAQWVAACRKRANACESADA